MRLNLRNRIQSFFMPFLKSLFYTCANVCVRKMRQDVL
nr:MAG TPA: Small RNA degrading nuclease 1 Recognition Motif, RNA BINDING [Caudoviricetes sp.]